MPGGEEIKKVRNFFDTYIWDGKSGGFIYHDLTIAIDKGLNYLVALGLMSYTEFLGSLMPELETEREPTPGRKNFYRFFYRLDKPYHRYEIYDEAMKVGFHPSGDDVYSIYRSGLVHNYFIRGTIQISASEKLSLGSFVAKKAKGVGSIGIGQNPATGSLGLATSTYFRDFTKLLSEWREKLFIAEDDEWVNAFLASIS